MPGKDVDIARQKAEEMYRSGQFLCSEAVFLVANEFLGRPVPDTCVRLASGFPVGMGMAGCSCGALTGDWATGVSHLTVPYDLFFAYRYRLSLALRRGRSYNFIRHDNI